MFEKIIVPLDGSDGAEIVLPYVTALAAAFAAGVELVTAAEAGAPEKNHLFESYLANVSKNLKSSLKERAGLKITTAIISGKPADEILKHAAQTGAGLIIIAVHGASGGNPLQMGNIASKILSGSKTPVLLVRGTAPKNVKAGDLIKRILVPLDGSKMSENSLKTVEPLADGLDAEVVLFQAVEPVRYVPSLDTVAPNVVMPSDGEIKTSAAKYLATIEEPVKKRGIKTSSLVAISSPADAIIDYAESGNIDIIAMTTHGFSGIKRWVFGSITEKILQAASRPVLVIPSGKS
jgi:nucleotide-binding universal stress UspA family protein